MVKEIHNLKFFSNKNFQTKDLGNLWYFLGIEVARSSYGINLCKRKYVFDILSETRMLGAKLVDTLMESNLKLTADREELLEDPGQYRRLIRKLIYLKYIICSWSCESIYTKFQKILLRWVIQILRFLEKNPKHGLFFRNDGHLQMEGYSNAGQISNL